VIAHYGYQDAEGEFFITIDTDRCGRCDGKPCVAACPRGVFTVEEDPYGDTVVAVDDRRRKRLRYECAGCKPAGDRPSLPCVRACPWGAMTHSW